MYGDVFDRISLFKGLSPAQRNLVRPLFVPFDAYGGTVLFEQGEPADSLYLVISGEVIIRYKPEDGPVICLARVRSGGVVGWSAALRRQAYTSGAECTIYSEIMRIHSEDLRILCEQYPETGELILERLAHVIAERLQDTNGQVLDLLKQGLAYGH
jgi:CRP/FNR family transcriptional regulator, cyclic AMP receptor protein